MDNAKYIGMDVHQATISVAVCDSAGKLLMECVIETKASTILELIRGLRGSLRITFEEGTHAAWLYDLLQPEVAEVLVCNPRQNALLRTGNKNDRMDARKLSDRCQTDLASQALAFVLHAGLLSDSPFLHTIMKAAPYLHQQPLVLR